ncbi:hypothetical protein [Nostoc sp. CMAA1605]|nr:hypothetical protein [Nostoc sp. CMAA1605]
MGTGDWEDGEVWGVWGERGKISSLSSHTSCLPNALCPYTD